VAVLGFGVYLFDSVSKSDMHDSHCVCFCRQHRLQRGWILGILDSVLETATANSYRDLTLGASTSSRHH